MRIIVGLVCLALLALMLSEFFVVFLLPRRVKRDPRIARGLLRVLWRPWRALALRLPRSSADELLGIFGPLGLLAMLGILSAGVIISFSGLHWADGSQFGTDGVGDFGDDLYFAAGAFFSATTPLAPTDGLGKVLQVAEAASGFGVIFIAIGYLPALFQAFSRRETAVAQLDPRAGSPPSAGALLERSGKRGGWKELDEYLREWETWAAELMETHLSYPILGYFRSQHVNQNWLAAMTTVTDACAYAMAYGPEEAVNAAALTFAICRHALADLAYTFRTGKVSYAPDRLTDENLAELRSRLEGSGLHAEEREQARRRLAELRESYEPNAIALSVLLALPLPAWLPGEDARENWRYASPRLFDLAPH
jgi:hypothetical protein